MLIYDKYYVGIKPDSDYMLGYAVPFTEDKAFLKRKESVDNWAAYGKQESMTITNEPTSGFKIVGFDSRYSTSNKVMEVLDPRGFKLQIYIEDFIVMLKTSVIDHGNMIGDYVWCKTAKGNNMLLNCESEEYKTITSANMNKTKSGKLKTSVVYPIGSFNYSANMSEIVLYLGVYSFASIYASDYYSRFSKNDGYVKYNSCEPKHLYLKYTIKDKKIIFETVKNKLSLGVNKNNVFSDEIKSVILDYKIKNMITDSDGVTLFKANVFCDNVYQHLRFVVDGSYAWGFENEKDVITHLDRIQNNVNKYFVHDLFKNCKDLNIRHQTVKKG